MSLKINQILAGLSTDENGVWCSELKNSSQQEEIKLREKVAAKIYDNYIQSGQALIIHLITK